MTMMVLSPAGEHFQTVDMIENPRGINRRQQPKQDQRQCNKSQKPWGKTKGVTSNVEKAADAAKNHEAPKVSAGKGRGQPEQLKAGTATKKAVEAEKKVQAREEKKAFPAKKKRETPEQKIAAMKATLEKEIEKAKAAEWVEEEASRMAAAKAASMSQSNLSFLNANAPAWKGRTEKTLEIRSDKKSKHAAGGSVNIVDFSAVPATSPQRKGMSSKRVQINEPPNSSGAMNETDDKILREGALIRPVRLFDDDVGYLSPTEMNQ